MVDNVKEWAKDRRREQNKLAKRRSRERKREGRQFRQTSDQSSQRSVNSVPRLIDGHVERQTSCCDGRNAHGEVKLTYLEFLHCFGSLSDIRNVVKILDAEGLGLAAIIKYGLISMGFAVDDGLYEKAIETCFSCWLKRIDSDMKGLVSISRAVYAGVYILSHLPGPPQWRFEAFQNSSGQALLCSETGSYLPRSITLTQLPFVSACLANAGQMGLSFSDMADDDCISPFVARPPGHLIPAGAEKRPLKTDLQPIPEQTIIPHHPYLDVIPYPSFRRRVLSAIYEGHSNFCEDELCFDLMHGGMLCWGSSQTSLYNRGDGTPWDSRSWEVAPWFLQKWSFLVGGCNDPMHRNSLWWRLHK